jgi:arsenate reductase
MVLFSKIHFPQISQINAAVLYLRTLALSAGKKRRHCMAKKILILCTGNSCRSQMAEGFLKSFDKNMEVYSAGTKPSGQVHPKAIQVMRESGINLSDNYPKSTDQFISQAFDYVITVCGNANENCPVFTGKVRHRMHIGFEDPAEAKGTEEEILSEFRKIRDQIKERFYDLYRKELKKKEP